VEHNWSVMQRDVRLFEVGHVFRTCGEASLPRETIRVAAVLTGARHPPHWTTSGRAPDLDLWDVKHMFEAVSRAGGPPEAVVSVDGERGWVLLDRAEAERGWARPLVADRPRWAAPLFGFEVELSDAARAPVKFEPLPGFPASERDLALVLPPGVTAAAVEAAMRSGAGPLLERVDVFDEYRGAEIAGRSVAWRLVFRDPGRTLLDEEVDAAVDRILATVRSELGIERRQA
jgi:phenylalanyl-tRNA synthetase beta chain